MTRLTSGETFAGYRIIELLGVGGMGEVYLAEHPRLPRRDALKVLRADASADPEFRARFLREADLAAGLWHPNIVGVHDRGEVDGRLWIAMDFIDGEDASRLLSRRYPDGMPAELVVAIAESIASALDYANSRGLLHRDIKPANILLADVDDAKKRRILLTDFGIARSSDDEIELTAADMVVGTVAYTAPEQLLGQQVDGRSEQYALAASAFHLLAGNTLFPESNPATVISHHLHSAPPPPSSRRPDLAAFDPVFARALAKDPQHRFPSCEGFALALAEAATARAETPTTVLPVAGAAPPPGWYPDPSGGAGRRYWDGRQWQEPASAGTGGITRRNALGALAIVAAAATTFVVVRGVRQKALDGQAAPPPTAELPPPAPQVDLGSAVEVSSRTGKARYTVSDLRPADPLLPAAVRGALYVADVTVESTTGVIKIYPAQFTARTAEGLQLPWTNNVANALPLADVSEGQTLSGPIAFDVPAGAEISEIILLGVLGKQIAVWVV